MSLLTNYSHAQFVDGMRPGVVRVKFKEGHQPLNYAGARTSGEVIITGIPAFDQINAGFGIKAIRRVFEPKGGNEAKLRRHGLHLWYEVTGDPGQNIATVIARYQALEEVELAEPDYEKYFEEGKPIRLAGLSAANGEMEYPMDDPALKDQWHYYNNGEWNPQAVAGADINLFKAWEKHGIYGDPRVIVSIHDEGVDVNHVDLRDNLWVNPGETGDGQDSDDNGYVDDLHGYNFAGQTPEISPDDHGTHVAGTVAATNNNGLGVSGVAGGSGNGDGARLMVCQILGDGGTPTTVAESYIYAADNGAVISQNSWGFNAPDVYEQVMLDAIRYFIAEAGDYEGSAMKGGIVIFASGNNNSNRKFYPGAWEEVMSVNSMAGDFKKASYSNYGLETDIMAPGGDGEGNGQVLSTMGEGGYGFMAGTSMACPHVSGVAALVLSREEYFGKLSPKELESILLSSVRDIYQYNDQAFRGQLGTGYIDAEMALRIDDGEGPAPVTDFTVAGSSFDMIRYTWTVPMDEVDEFPDYYEFTWSTSADFSEATVVKIPNNWQAAGEAFEYRLGKLAHLDYQTKVYAKLQAFDRWGNSNTPTNSIEAEILKTAVFEVTYDNQGWNGSHSINVDYKNQHTPSLTIKNMAEPGVGGALEWNLSSGLETLGREDIIAREAAEIPAPAKSTSGRMVSGETPLVHASVSADEMPDVLSNPNDPDYTGDLDDELRFRLTLDYIDPEKTLMYVGSGDRYVEHSIAQRFQAPISEDPGVASSNFVVDYVRFMHHGRPDFYGNETVEILIGPDFESARRIMAFEAEDVVLGPGAEDMEQAASLTRYADLPNRLVLGAGEYFWVVVHFPAGKFNSTPAVLAGWSDKSLDKTAKLSYNGGYDWIDLNEELLEKMPQRYGSVWGISIFSALAQEKKMLYPNIDQGILAAGEEQVVEFELDVEEVKAGMHEFYHAFVTNENETTYHNLEVELNLNGVNPEFEYQGKVDFGRVFDGAVKSKNWFISNIGYADANISWQIENADGSPEEVFKLDNSYMNLNARYRNKMKIHFAPQEEKEYYAVLKGTMWGLDEEIRVILSGNGVAPSELALSPAEVNAGDFDLNDGQQDGYSFTIENKGKAPLEYIIAAYSDKDLPDYERSNDYGYTYNTDWEYALLDQEEATPEDRPYFNDISNHAEVQDLTEQMRVPGTLECKIDLGFAFPFFKDHFGYVYASKYGNLAFSEFIYNASPTFQSVHMPDGYIAAIYSDLSFNDGGRILYLKEEGKVTVQYDQVKIPDTFSDAFSFQYVLYENGDFEMLYDSSFPTNFYSAPGLELRRITYVGVESADREDGLLFKFWNGFPATGYDIFSSDDMEKMRTSGLATYLQFHNPGVALATNLSKTEGMLMPEESEEITFSIDPSQWFEGEFEQYIGIVSNDPNATSKGVHLTMDIISGGEAEIETIVENLKFDVFHHQEANSKFVPLNNRGTAAFTLEDVNFSGAGFSLADESVIGRRVKPQETVVLEVVPNTSELGIFQTDMEIQLSTRTAGNLAPMVIPVESNVIEMAEFHWDWGTTSTELEIDPEGEASVPFTVKNEGRSYLEFFFNTDNWANVYDLEGTNEVFDVEYQMEMGRYSCWKNPDDNWGPDICGHQGPAYEWVDLSKHPQAEYMPDLDAFNDNPFAKKDLPFEFEFYGKKYAFVNICSFGFVTFNEVENKIWDDPRIIPYIPHEDSRWQTLIAPLYHVVSPNFYDFPDEAGVYYLEEEDRVIIQYHRYRDTFSMGDTMDWQLILFKTGEFKFQYHMPDLPNWDDMYFLDEFGSIGIQSEDKTKGQQVVFMEKLLEDQMVFHFKPQYKFKLAPGQTGQYDLLVEGHKVPITGGEGQVQAVTNIPGTEEDYKHELRVKLTGKGIATPEHKEVDLGLVFYESLNVMGAEGVMSSMYMTNTGNNPIEITGGGFEMESIHLKLGRYAGSEWFKEFTPYEQYDFETPEVIQPGETFEFYTLLTPEYRLNENWQWELVHADFVELNTNLKFSWRDQDEQIIHEMVIPWKSALGNSPIYGGHDEIIRGEVLRGAQKDFKISLTNEGESPMTFKAAIEYYRQSEPFSRYLQEEIVEADALMENLLSGHVTPGVMADAMEGDIPDPEDHLHFFEHSSSVESLDFIGFGAGMPFSAGVKFQAPEEGTKISKVWTMCRIEKAEVADIKVSIYRGGASPESAELVWEQTAVKMWEEEEEVPHWFAIDLEETVEVLPYENFYVQITYSSNIGLPQGYHQLRSPQPGSNYAISQGRWVDVMNLGLGMAAWQIKAAAEEEGENAWLTFPSGNEGTVDIESTGSIDFMVDASKEVDDFLYAEITFRTNDMNVLRPYHTEVMLEVVNPVSTEQEVTLGIYPNPVSDFLTIAFQADAAGDGVVEIFSTTGQKMLVHQELVHVGLNEIKLPVSGLPTGLFIVRVSTEHALIGQANMIKQ